MKKPRETILARLAASTGPVSGDGLALELGISRAGVWKHIEILRGQGIHIEAVTGRGYILRSDVLAPSVLEARLQTRFIGRPCLVLDEVDSTNSEAVRLAAEGAGEGLVVIAKRQTSGRGRLGRNWHTFGDDGLAISILLRPDLPPEQISQLTLVAGVSCHRALSNFSPDIGLKWPNDLLHNGKKLAGILTEMRAEPGHVQAVIIGIGINVRAPADGWPADITQPVTDLSTVAGKTVSRLDVAIRLIESMEAVYVDFLKHGFASIREQWWQAHAASGKPVRVHDGKRYITGFADSLDTDGALLLRTQSGIERIIAGDLELMT